MVIYSCAIGSMLLLGFLRALLFFKVAFDASQALHDKMFVSLLRARMRFFDTNPVGKFAEHFFNYN